MFDYVSDTSGWKEWMPEYQYGAFYIFPPDDIIGPLDALREAYDPKSHRICQAHISLTEPLPAPLSGPQLDEIRAALATVAPFDVTYGPLRWFPPHPGLCYRIEPEETIRSLRAILHSLPCFAGIKPRHDIAPHMTIAEFITRERTEELLRELDGRVPAGTFRCEGIEYAVPDRDFRFQRVLRMPFGR